MDAPDSNTAVSWRFLVLSRACISFITVKQEPPSLTQEITNIP